MCGLRDCYYCCHAATTALLLLAPLLLLAAVRELLKHAARFATSTVHKLRCSPLSATSLCRAFADPYKPVSASSLCAEAHQALRNCSASSTAGLQVLFNL
jgi:hypothetical protein